MKSLLLTIYAYSSFVSPWGPGPKLVEEFRKECKCEVTLKDMGDTNLFLQKLKDKKISGPVDVILGLDQLSADKIISHNPSGNTYFDSSPLAFVYKKNMLKDPPRKLDDLLDPRYKNQILLQDPRLSSPGLQFLVWVFHAKKDRTKDFLEKLKPQIHSISPSWSTAYGLFKKDQAPLVFSYLSSPVYHWLEEKDQNYASLAFEEAHPIQYESVLIPEGCSSCELAQKFAGYMHSKPSQKTLMEKNYMFPADPKLIKGTAYEKLPKVKTISLEEYEKLKIDELLKVWKDVFK